MFGGRKTAHNNYAQETIYKLQERQKLILCASELVLNVGGRNRSCRLEFGRLYGFVIDGERHACTRASEKRIEGENANVHDEAHNRQTAQRKEHNELGLKAKQLAVHERSGSADGLEQSPA